MEHSDLKRQAKVVDMMLTMHSVLADRYHKKAQAVEITLIAVSLMLCVIAFVDPKILEYFHIPQERGRILNGIGTVLVFFLSVLLLVVDWKGKSIEHRKAFNALIPLKSEWSAILSNPDESDGPSRAEFMRKSALIIGTLIPIPDSQFNRLKALHFKKVELSKLISANPGSSARLLRLSLWYHSNKDSVRRTQTKIDSGQ